MSVTIVKKGKLKSVPLVLTGECGNCGEVVTATSYDDCKDLNRPYSIPGSRYAIKCSSCYRWIPVEQEPQAGYVTKGELLEMLDNVSVSLENVLLHFQKQEPCVVASDDWQSRMASCDKVRRICDKLLR